MTRCTHVGSKHRVVCTGALNKRITLQNRNIVPPIFGSADFDESFTGTDERWASIVTTAGKAVFDGVNQRDNEITHEFYIRYDVTVTKETWILFESRRFDIVLVEDFEERHEWMRLLCTDKLASKV